MSTANDNFKSPFNPQDLPVWAKRVVVFDTETTGLDLREARIVTACLAELDENGQIVGQALEWLADPKIEIPEAASNVHGVTTEYAREHGRDAGEVVAEILAKIAEYQMAGVAIVAYNAPYDFTILHFEALRHGLSPISEPSPVLDPLVIDKFADQYRKGKRKLEITAEFYGIPLSDAHNATADAVAAGRVLQAIAAKHAAKLPATADEIHAAQVGWSAAQDESFAKWMRGNVNPDFVTNIGWPLKLG